MPRRSQNGQPNNTVSEHVQDDLFLEPMMGIPLAIYIEKDVPDRDTIVDLVTNHGGIVSPGYSGVPYILVDPHRESGQSLYRQYAGKKGKVVLSSRWVHECIKGGALQTYLTNWAGCKVTGAENVVPSSTAQPRQLVDMNGVPTTLHPTSLQVLPSQTMQPPPEALVQHPVPPFSYQMYPSPIDPSRSLAPGHSQPWHGSNGIPPQHPHLAHIMPRPENYREDPWNNAYAPPQPHPTHPMQSADYDYGRYREAQGNWGVSGPNEYYNQAYEQPSYDQSAAYISEPGPSAAPQASPTSSSVITETDKSRGRKRTRAQPAPPTSSLVISRGSGGARSPTPPTRVIKSTYGGNLFTADDVLYLKRYIDYCQEQGLVLSLREICERVAVKAPHHTFYSWRRYCNKHQIRLGGYAMAERSPSPNQDNQVGEIEPEPSLNPPSIPGPGTIAAARQRVQADAGRTRSPTPPRALFRSTTGKGVAFTEEDVTFLVRFMEYKKAQGRLDMVAFWKEVAAKAPHHSRASWMKFYRRHKHELHHEEGDDPLPAPPEKKMRYSRSDDVLLAEYFLHKPEGTSDKIFQSFARLNPHHPWKGWQEHHRIHKAKIDNLIQKLENGENIDDTVT